MKISSNVDKGDNRIEVITRITNWSMIAQGVLGINLLTMRWRTGKKSNATLEIKPKYTVTHARRVNQREGLFNCANLPLG